MLDDMLTGTQRIRRIVDELRDFARQGPTDLSAGVDLNEVVATAIRLVDSTIRHATDHFEVRYGKQLPAFVGNAQRIEQVIINLLLNACQSLEGSGKSIRIRTSLTNSDHLCLEVQDQGRGIASDDIPRLSDPFFTTRREEGGTGLGLSVSASIVQEHDGTLTFDSRPGRGTTATLILPLVSKKQAP